MIFKERKHFKPFEYPDVMKFVEAINHSYWLHSELNFISDIQDFKNNLSPVEKNAIHKTLLAISQIEVKVKGFWSDLYKHIPKPEINAVGATFAESEVRHERSYSHLLEVLGLNDDFALLMGVPEINGRVDYLSKYLEETYKNDKRQFTFSLALFSIFVENVSLFSQFAIILSFNRFKNSLKDISNIVEWTMKEELLHGQFGIYLINQIKLENPEWFNDRFYHKLYKASLKAYEAECAIIDWIFSDGELDFLSKDTLKEFIKKRLNESLKSIGGEQIFDVNKKAAKGTLWFDEEIYSNTMTDFFHKRPTGYAKRTKSVTEDDLF